MFRLFARTFFYLIIHSTFREGETARILGLLPYKGKSHNLVTLPLLSQLALRGHDLTVVGYHQIQNPPLNYRTILLEDEQCTEFLTFNDVFRPDESFVTWSMEQLYNLTLPYEEILKNPKLSALLKEKFDLVITEYFNSDAFLGFVRMTGAPHVFIHTTYPAPWHMTATSDPLETSYVPHVFSDFDGETGFWGRFHNFLEVFSILRTYDRQFQSFAETATANTFNSGVPLGDIAKNASLYLMNSHFSVHGVRPTNPGTIQVGGLNIVPAKPLPPDWQKLLDNSRYGVIYFSMGSVLKGASLDNRRRDAFLKVFSERKETILWKWEGDLPNKPKNVHAYNWLPQRDIFAHPNVRLYIGHGGVHGIHEAVTEALPTICIPMFGDQPFNCKRLQLIGMGLGLNFRDLDEDAIRVAVNTVLGQSGFKENAIKISAAFKDRPMSAMDTAIYWVEYVIRHNGAPHLMSPARHLSWIEYYNLDVIAILTVALVAPMFVLLKLMVIVLRTLMTRKKQKIS